MNDWKKQKWICKKNSDYKWNVYEVGRMRCVVFNELKMVCVYITNLHNKSLKKGGEE